MGSSWPDSLGLFGVNDARIPAGEGIAAAFIENAN
jgi:hypothetical protein